jgi:DNA-binding NarL/FixJ family response regulator
MRVLIVDDAPAVREALRLLLSEEPSVEIVGEAADGETALALAAALRPEVVLLDLEGPRLNGLAIIPALCAQPQPPQVVALSLDGSAEGARQQALTAGAAAFVEKGATLPEVVAALRAVVQRAAPPPGS